MWRKSEESKLKPSPDASSSPDSSSRHPSAAAALDSSSAPATVSQGIKIKGEISGQGDFFLDGAFEGKVQLADGTFTIGPNARVTAEIEAREIIVRGEVIGTLKAKERVQIWSTGKVTGDMDTRGIMIEDGAVLHGKVAVPQATVRDVARPELSASEAVGEKDQPPQAARPETSTRSKGAAAGAAAKPNAAEP